MVDIYTRIPGEAKYTSGQFDVSNELDIHVQQILMLLKTERGSVLGDPKFGFNLDSLVFEQHLRESEIEEQINEQINFYCFLTDKFSTKAAVTFYKGPTYDYCLIDVLVDGEKIIGVLVS